MFWDVDPSVRLVLLGLLDLWTVALVVWGVARICPGGASALRVVAVSFLMIVFALWVGRVSWTVHFFIISDLFPSNTPPILEFSLLALGLIAMPTASVVGFVWWLRYIRRKLSGGPESEMAEPTGWTVAMIWIRGASAWRVAAALFLAPAVAISALAGWDFVVYLVDPLILFRSPWTDLLQFGSIVMPVVAVGGFIWLMRRIGRKPSGAAGSETAEPDV